MRQNNYSLVDSVATALNPLNILKKLLYVILVIGILSIRELIHYLNEYGQLGYVWYVALIKAVIPAYLDGSRVIFSSVWTFLVDIFTFQFTYFETHSYGNIVFGIIFFLGAMWSSYQLVSIVIDILDFKRGDVTSFIFKVLWTFLFVVLISASIYYSGGQSALTEPATNIINQTIENVTQNVTSTMEGTINLN